MLLPASQFIDMPIMGLQTGSELARTQSAVVDPGSLKILAYEVTGVLLGQTPTFIRIADVREFSDIGMIVDSSDEFVTTGDIIKLDEIYALGFNPVGMKVRDEKKRKVGKITDYTVDTKGFYVHQLNVRRPLLASLNESQLLIHRSQIIEINDEAIVIHSKAEASEQPIEVAKQVYVNPFRKPTSAQADQAKQA